jgi:hypothetical protein
MNGLVLGIMEKQRTIISEWLLGKSKEQRSNILGSMAEQFSIPESLPIEGVLEQLAVCVLAACANDLGLSTMELSGLLYEPRKDALAGLITVVRGDEQ